VAPQGNGQSRLNGDPALRRIFEEIRDLRREMRDDRREAAADRHHWEAEVRRWEVDRKRRDARFERRLLHAEARTQKMFQDLRRDIRSVGLAIVKTLNVHTRLLVGIDRKLGARRNGGLSHNGPAA
jgi:hypothetical protein